MTRPKTRKNSADRAKAKAKVFNERMDRAIKIYHWHFLFETTGSMFELRY